jgi:hypothetical protein
LSNLIQIKGSGGVYKVPENGRVWIQFAANGATAPSISIRDGEALLIYPVATVANVLYSVMYHFKAGDFFTLDTHAIWYDVYFAEGESS